MLTKFKKKIRMTSLPLDGRGVGLKVGKAVGIKVGRKVGTGVGTNVGLTLGADETKLGL